MSQANRWIAPPGGPAPTPAKLADWATAELLAVPGALLANRRDLPALQATMLAERVALPVHGVVQAGTLWLQEAPV